MEHRIVILVIVVIAAVSIAAYGNISGLKNVAVTGFSVINKTESDSDKNKLAVLNSSIAQTSAETKCPSYCGDNNTCTSDYCNDKTNYQCVHETIIGCCELGEVYCNGGCQPVRCIVDKDCDDANSFTDDKCINSNSCNATCVHSLIPNICGNGVCESNENYSTCPKDCSFLAPAQNVPQNDSTYNISQNNALKVSITTDNQNYPNYKGNVTITVLVTTGSSPVVSANVNVSVKYASDYTKKTYNVTNNDGLFIWNFVIGTSKPGVVPGIFNASIIASKDSYDNGYNYTLFNVFNSTNG